ncbi:hypothetical protein IQ266_04190 [filamentous cyanobacterium LEGE 11480]|uniref:Uncharacterized protein n=2 Tax=Romeriopsis TaxID=2992131 RepID=A0A928VJU5_9CYAN|nr:hypothetical protein [Romeriopsis navalis LEGE 11480]
MKSLARKVTTFGLLGTTVLSPVLLSAQPVEALPKKDVLDKLGPVLIYTVVAVDKAKNQAVPLTAEVQKGKEKFNVAWVFFSPQEAQKFVDKQKQEATALKTKDPKAAAAQMKILNNTIVAPDSLATFYEAATSSKSALKLQFVPIVQEVKQAKGIESKFQGVPLFRVNFGKNRYGTSFFFSKKELDTELESLKKSQPKLARDAKIEVVPLEGLIDVLSRENGEDLKKVRLLAPLESRKLLRKIYEQTRGKDKPAPAATPKK